MSKERALSIETIIENIHIEETGCYRWIARLDSNGYGSLWHNGHNASAHRTVYSVFVGHIPDELELDHLCRNPSCVNPDHLEPVTHKENMRRSMAWPGINARKTHCIKGHLLDKGNTHIEQTGSRRCRRCRADAKKRWESKHISVAPDRHHRYRLTESQECQIKTLYSVSHMKQNALANQFGVSTSLINNIINNKRPSNTTEKRRQPR